MIEQIASLHSALFNMACENSILGDQTLSPVGDVMGKGLLTLALILYARPHLMTFGICGLNNKFTEH